MHIDKFAQKLAQQIAQVLNTKYQIEIKSEEVQLEHPAQVDHGDWSTNIAMKLANQLKQAPRAIAEMLVPELTSVEYVIKVEIAGPGFINFYIDEKYYLQQVQSIITAGDSFGSFDLGRDKQVMVEFGQPNTHKDFTVGHLRSAISGMAIVKLHENMGFDVIKANFFGDVGMHVAKATWGFLKQGEPADFNNKNLDEQMAYIAGCYIFGNGQFKENDDLANEMKVINKEIYAKTPGEVWDTYYRLREISLAYQKEVWANLGVSYDREYPESEISEKAVTLVKTLQGNILEQSEGAWVFKGEKYGLNTWVFLTGEGNPTYSAKDLALAETKFKEYPNLHKGIVTTSTEQSAYFKGVIKVIELHNPELTGRYQHMPFGWLLKDGKKTSSRLGNAIKGIDVVDEAKEQTRAKISGMKQYSEDQVKEIEHKVAMAGLKFLILSHEFHKDINYHPEQFADFEGFSGPYVMYAYARSKAILRNSEHNVEGELALDATDLHVEETKLIKLLNKYPEFAYLAGEQLAPHLIAGYVYEVAQQFNKFYQECPVLTIDNMIVKQRRINLCAATSQVIKNGLGLLGIETVEQM